jgi:nucleoside-diphosphate-sugar epimerase
MTRALVTGGAGYFGDLLVRRLREGAYDVRVLDLCKPEDPYAGVENIQGDIRDPPVVARACRGIDVVFHNVAQVPLAKDKRLFWSVNRDGTRTLLEACLALNVRRLVYTSTSAIYGVPKSNPVSEATEPAPREDYGKAKLAAESLCWEYASRGFEISIVRPRTIIGHGRLGIFQILFEWIYQGKNIPVLDSGKNIYQFIHADDLAEACILASKAPAGTGKLMSARGNGIASEIAASVARGSCDGRMLQARNFAARRLSLAHVWALHVLRHIKSPD